MAELGNRSQKAATEKAPPQINNNNGGDVVELSNHSRMVARSMELANGAPDIRQDKVADLKSRISAGTYSVSGQTVAEAMLKTSILEI